MLTMSSKRYIINLYYLMFGEKMETKYYRVVRIEGEYAYLEEENTKDEVFVALALLPAGVDVGTRLKSEMLSYEIID